MTAPYYEDESVTLHHGDCLDVLRSLPDNSVDSVVTDPPYNLSFMGRAWDDHQTPMGFQQWCEQWAAECLRVLKPGGHLLAFGGTRTWHRLAVAVEDAGFEVRDSIAWLYGSGFPKSLDVSKAIDKRRDDYPAIRSVIEYIRAGLERARGTRTELGMALGGVAAADHFLKLSKSNAACPSWDQWLVIKEIAELDDEMDAEVWRLNGRKGTPGEAWEQREVVGQSAHKSGIANGTAGHHTVGGTVAEHYDITAPATPAAQQWQGWGTALKPSHEPIVVARKPLVGTVAANVLAHGTGALNVDGCRVGTGQDKGVWPVTDREHGRLTFEGGVRTPRPTDTAQGRWPANVLLDGSQADALDEQSGTSIGRPAKAALDGTGSGSGQPASGVPFVGGIAATGYTDSGGASRFFPTFRYQAKAPSRERPSYVKDGAGTGRVTGLGGKVRQCNVCETRAIESGASEPSCGHGDFRWEQPTTDTGSKVAHPTVKPLELMRWLVRLVTPPGGVVLEPFAGSGTTVEAAVLEGFRCVAIEREADYLPLILERIRRSATSSLTPQDAAAAEALALFDFEEPA